MWLLLLALLAAPTGASAQDWVFPSEKSLNASLQLGANREPLMESPVEESLRKACGVWATGQTNEAQTAFREFQKGLRDTGRSMMDAARAKLSEENFRKLKRVFGAASPEDAFVKAWNGALKGFEITQKACDEPRLRGDTSEVGVMEEEGPFAQERILQGAGIRVKILPLIEKRDEKYVAFVVPKDWILQYLGKTLPRLFALILEGMNPEYRPFNVQDYLDYAHLWIDGFGLLVDSEGALQTKAFETYDGTEQMIVKMRQEAFSALVASPRYSMKARYRFVGELSPWIHDAKPTFDEWVRAYAMQGRSEFDLVNYFVASEKKRVDPSSVTRFDSFLKSQQRQGTSQGGRSADENRSVDQIE
ncbi:MAG: hypothetical protein V1798_10525 [Pseudomonadota bacterium]